MQNPVNNTKKLSALALSSLLALGIATSPALAAYQLSDEVKTATPALKMAASIGVLSSENKALAQQPNKDAILVMSFGTTFKDTREKTIDATVRDIQAAHPGVRVVTAFTSHIIIERVKKKEGISYPTPEEALARLKKEGYTRVALVSLDIIPGVEYAYKVGVYYQHRDEFKKMSLGTPLMYWQGQEDQDDDVSETMQALATQFPKLAADEGVLLMAHGTPHPANAYYAVMQARLEELGHDRVFIYSVEGWPGLEDVMKKAQAKGIQTVTLIPMMMVAGDHANNDMAGDEDDSHKKILEKAGFTVKTDIRGMGENEAIRKVFVQRADAAWQALEGEK